MNKVTIFASALVAVTNALNLESTNVNADGWTTVEVEAPPEKCCIDEWNSNECNVLQRAVNAASEKTIIKIGTGQYCNEEWFNQGRRGPADRTHGTLVKINNKKDLKLVAANSNDPAPLLSFDGWGGITILNSEGITVRGLEIEGPNMNITAEEASN